MQKGICTHQNTALRDAKVWRRKLAKRAAAARRRGEKVPDALLVVTRASTPTAVAGQLASMTKLVQENLAALGKGAQALLDQGTQAAAALGAADATQETKRLGDLPKAVRAFYAKKGELYTALKVINDAGQELHAAEPENAAKYNLKVLYRRAAPKKKPA